MNDHENQRKKKIAEEKKQPTNVQSWFRSKLQHYHADLFNILHTGILSALYFEVYIYTLFRSYGSLSSVHWLVAIHTIQQTIECLGPGVLTYICTYFMLYLDWSRNQIHIEFVYGYVVHGFPSLDSIETWSDSNCPCRGVRPSALCLGHSTIYIIAQSFTEWCI